MSEDDTYSVLLDCGNCHAPNYVQIPKGTTVTQRVTFKRPSPYPHNHDAPRCTICGCQKLDSTTAEAVLW